MLNFPLNSVHFHLILVHFPIVLSTILPFLLIYWLYRKNNEIIKLSLFGFIITALISIPVYITWNNAMPRVSSIKWINIQALINHNKTASIAFNFIIFLWIISLITYFINKKDNYNKYRYTLYLLLVFSFITLWAVTIAWNYWWNIRHSEINSIP